MSDQFKSGTWTARYEEPWERVSHFKVNKWMLELGAKWTVSEERAKQGATGIGDQWELNGMIISQKDAAKWYLATHPHKWWRFW